MGPTRENVLISAVRTATAGGAGVGRFRGRRGPYAPLGQLGGETVHEGGAVEEDDGTAERLLRRFGARTREPSAARCAQPVVPLPGAQTADLVSEPDDLEGALGVGGEGLTFSCAARSDHDAVPSKEELSRGFGELLRGTLG
ncbi:hypothetical protein [Streptomyces sp. NBC_01471]|uniref:hypothetical protein n=1 Tax=Streptomyces sp. NBC_01471 TaxID=2903879 RepID=UPI00352EDB41